MKASELRASILQEAVSGRLVPQNPSEGTAEDLLKEIAKERDSLIKAGKIKKEKPLPEITEDEIPFEIPKTWKWVRIGNLCWKLTDGTHQTPKYTYTGIPFLSVKDMSSGNIDFSDTKFISECEHQILYSRCNPEKGDILLSKIGTTGIPALVDTEREFSLFVSVALLKVFNIVNRWYLINAIKSPVVQIQCDIATIGMANKNWVIKRIANTLIPLPPLAEQKRIVAKIEELMPFIDEYGEEEEKLSTFSSKFPEDIRKSILQEAVSGRLVPQDPLEGTAEELLKDIEKERESLVKAGKIKKEKPLPEITDDEIPFEIPKTWKWVRLGDIGDYKKGPFGSSLTKSMFVKKSENAIKVYEQKNAIQKNENLGTYYISNEYFERSMSGFEVVPGDIIVSCAGTIGETFILPINSERGIINQALMRIRLTKIIDKDYYLLCFDSLLKSAAKNKSNGSAIKNIPPFEILKKLLIPLPPLDEQKRIVDKVEELMNIVENRISNIK